MMRRVAFELYIEEHKELVDNQLKIIDRYNHIRAENQNKTEVYKERLRVGVALNNLLREWRRDSIGGV